MTWRNDLHLNEAVVGSLTAVAEQYLHLAGDRSNDDFLMGRDADDLVEHILTPRVVERDWRPRGRLSANGRCHLMPTADGQWVALNLARPGDVDVFRAVLLGTSTATDRSDLECFEGAVASWSAEDLVDATHDLGVPLSRVGEVEWSGSLAELPIRHQWGHDDQLSDRGGSRSPGPPVKVLDLSTLWAGPLCSRLLLAAGCLVTTVESIHRPDPTRWSHPLFFADLHRGKEHVRLDFARERRRLEALIEQSDVVIVNSRPAALRRLGLESGHFVDGVRLWVSITGYGGDNPEDVDRGASLRVGFGDDCAVAGGLVNWSVDGPGFLGDAVADPATGLVAATAILSELGSGVVHRSGHMRVALAECANWVLRGGGVHCHRRD